jgi:ubiquitin-protein ligase
MSTVRLRRLQADYEKLQRYVSSHPRLQLIQAEGDPPERYQLEYRVRGLRQKDGALVEVRSHLVEIALPRDYPRVPPVCRMLTPVFHPNIAPHAICIGDHWSAGEPLSSIVARIGEMISFQSYNTKSPLNGEAARWTEENIARLPLDQVSMVPEEPAAPAAGPTGTGPPDLSLPPDMTAAAPQAVATRAPAPAAPAAAPPAEPFVFACTCGARLRATPDRIGKLVRCPRCQAVQSVPPPPPGA